MLEVNRIYNNDCLELMKQLPDKCIDLVLTDPPYGIGISGSVGGGSHRGKVKECKKCDWDNQIPSKEYFHLETLLPDRKEEELLGCQNLNLYEGALWQLLYSYGRTSWIWLAEELGINLVHGCEIVHAVQIDGSLHYVRKIGAGCLQNVLGIGEALTSLLLDAALYEVACCRVDRNLT